MIIVGGADLSTRFIENTQMGETPLFFSRHCPHELSTLSPSGTACSAFSYKHTGEDPRSNGQVVLEIWPTKDSEKKSRAGGSRTRVGAGFDPRSRCFVDFSHDHVVTLVHATHQKMRKQTTHRMSWFRPRSGKWKLRKTGNTDCGFEAATWSREFKRDHKANRTCV
jgi:hypothetical protein